jgi:hypothetical protein
MASMMGGLPAASRYSRNGIGAVQILYRGDFITSVPSWWRSPDQTVVSRERHSMTLLIKRLIVVFLIVWSVLGAWLVAKYELLFGPNPDHRDETPGARSFGIVHIAAVWVGAFALGVWFLFL